MHTSRLIASGSFCAMVGLFAGPALADCSALPGQAALKTALVNATFNLGANGGFGFNMWGTIVDNSGIVCCGVHGRELYLTMAWEPGDFGAEGEYGQRIQPV